MCRLRRQMWREKAEAAAHAVPGTAADGAETLCSSDQSQEPFLDDPSQACSGASTTATNEPLLLAHQSGPGQHASADSSTADAQQSPDAAAAKAATSSSVFQAEQ
jgi:hypothetical protein